LRFGDLHRRLAFCPALGGFLHLICGEDSREAFRTGVAIVLQNTGHHILVPRLVRVVGRAFFFQMISDVIEGCPGQIAGIDVLHRLCFLRLNDYLAHDHLVPEGQLSVAHYRTVLSMLSRSSSPFFRRNRRLVLLSMMTLSIS